MRSEYKSSKSKWRCLHFLLAFLSVRSHHPRPADKSTNTLANSAAAQCKYIQINKKNEILVCHLDKRTLGPSSPGGPGRPMGPISP